MNNDKAISHHIVSVLHDAREEAIQHGHNVARVSIGFYLGEVRLADDTGAYVWNVTKYRPFTPVTLGVPHSTTCVIAGYALLHFEKETRGEFRPSDQQLKEYRQCAH